MNGSDQEKKDELIRVLIFLACCHTIVVAKKDGKNSYNAASEGIFLSEYSFISSIQPHLELLKNLPYKKCKFNSLDDDVLFLKKEELSAYNLKTWDQLIHEMLADAGLN